MSFQDPGWLLALVLVPAGLVAYVLARRRRPRYAVRFPALSTLREAAGTTSSWERHLPTALVLLAVAVLVVALARPHVTDRVSIGAAALMLVSDESGSMAANDVLPSRLMAAESAANRLISELPSTVRLGAIAFSTQPNAVQAPAVNHAAARSLIDAQSAGGGTDTGDALTLALGLLHGGVAHHAPAAIVLLSDGAANLGPPPVSVAQQAKLDHIPIFTVALGTPGGVLQGAGPFGQSEPVPPDPQLMAAIAETSGGRSFDAQTADELSSIYKELGSKLGSAPRKREITALFAVAGMIVLVVGVGLSVRSTGLVV
jgi:Ca-activated chloride channel homolog